MPSNYDGNSIGFTLTGALKVLLYLFKVSFPGYFLLSPTYRYLNTIYNNLKLIDFIRVGMVGLGVLIVFYYSLAFGKKNRIKSNGWLNLGIIIASIIYAALPALPLAISAMYQNNVGESTGFIALPVSYFTYFSATFLCCFVAWKILQRCSKWLSILLLFIMASSVCMPVQYMNSNFSNIQNDNFSRLTDIENFLTTDYILSMNDAKIISQDIFETRLSLGVHESYWQDNLRRLGSNIEISKGNPKEFVDKNTYYLTYADDDYFMLEGINTITLAFKKYKEDQIVQLANEDLIKLSLENPLYENGYYIFVISKLPENF